MKEHEKYKLSLYIAGITTENQDGVLQLKRRLKDALGDGYILEVVDIFSEPELAESARIIATPTLLRALPAPAQKVILDFSNEKKMLLGIDLLLDLDGPR